MVDHCNVERNGVVGTFGGESDKLQKNNIKSKGIETSSQTGFSEKPLYLHSLGISNYEFSLIN